MRPAQDGPARPRLGRAVHAGALCRGKQGGRRAGYLHEALITRKGIPAVLAVLYAEVMQRLLARRAVAFAVRIDCTRLDECAPVAPAACFWASRLPARSVRVVWMRKREAAERVKHSAMHACARMQVCLACCSSRAFARRDIASQGGDMSRHVLCLP